MCPECKIAIDRWKLGPASERPGAQLATVVDMPKPEVDEMLDALDKLRERVAAGELESIWIIGWTHDRHLITAERGKALDRLMKIGIIECFKQDLITCMDTGDESGL